MALLEINNDFIRDERFSELGELTKRGKFDARGRVENLWIDCIDKTQDVRTAEEIDNFTGWFNSELGSFADLMVKARLAEFLPGDSKQLLGLYRIKGVRERMEWLVDIRKKRADAGALGGKVRAQNAKRDENGHFIPQDDQANNENTQGDPSKCLDATTQNQANPGGTVPGPVSVPGSSSKSDPDSENYSPSKKARESVFNFEIVYKNYPRKLGKAKAFKVLSETIKTGDDFADLSRAVSNYALDCELNKTPSGYIKHFSSFVGTKDIETWRDYINLTPAIRATNTKINKSEQRELANKNALEQALKNVGVKS